MSNFVAIENALLLGVTGGEDPPAAEPTVGPGCTRTAVEGSALVAPYGYGSGKVKTEECLPSDPYLACTTVANKQFGGWFGSRRRLDKALDLCQQNYGRK